MKKIYFSTIRLFVVAQLIIFCIAIQPVFGQSGVRIARTTGTADPSAVLDVVSDGTPSWKGFLLPRMTSAAKLAIPTPATGLLIYQTDGSTGLYYYNGSAWVQLSAGALSGAGTTNMLAKWTSSSGIGNSLIFDNGTNVGIGTTTPTQLFQVVGGNVQISNMAGSGYRPVNADPSGTLKAVTYFNCTGADQTYTVPAGVTSITVKMWGAGGGGGHRGGWQMAFPGGGGGYTTGTIAVTAGTTYYIMVGQGGGAGNMTNYNQSYGGGGRSCGGGTDCQYCGAGGGRSAFRNAANSADLLTAGGGGGGGSTTGLAATSTCRGGAGGGTTGQNGECIQTAAWAGSGGGQGAGGVGGTGVSQLGVAGSQYAGGAVAAGGQSYGGGGGGGWYGGGSGSYSANSMGGGGGGSGYISGLGVSAATTTTGSFQIPAGVSDPNYQAGVGFGGLGGAGGNGLVVIIAN